MIPGFRSIALFPFLVFHAKGGEVALLGSPWDLHGFGHKHMRLSFLCACVHLFALVKLGLPFSNFICLKVMRH